MIKIESLWMVHTSVDVMPNSLQGPFLFGSKDEAVAFCHQIGATETLPPCTGEFCDRASANIIKFRGNIITSQGKPRVKRAQKGKVYALVSQPLTPPPAKDFIWWDIVSEAD